MTTWANAASPTTEPSAPGPNPIPVWKPEISPLVTCTPGARTRIPYSGGGPQCLAYCYDKSLVRGVAAEMDIPVPRAFTVAPEEVAFISFPIEFPVIVKPNFGDSSVGITVDSVCSDIGQLEQAIASGVKNIWMQPGAESKAAVAAAQAAGLNVIADGSCLLVVLGYREH